MMGYQLFKDVVAQRLPELLPPMYADCKVRVSTVRKINEEKDTLNVMPGRSEGEFAISPNLYLDDLYEEFKQCQDMDFVLNKMAAYIVQFAGKAPAEAVEFDLSKMQDRIVMNLINTEYNRELLKTAPHREVMDLSIIYRIIMTQDGGGLNTIMVNDAILETLNLTAEELDALAYRNTVRMFPAELVKMSDQLYMMTNSVKIHGATTILYQEMIRGLSEQVGQSIYIIPSSVHEVMLVPEQEADLIRLTQMLAEGNRLYVTEREFLSSSIYYYNREKDSLFLAASYFSSEEAERAELK